MSKVFVLGAAGYIGREVVREAVARGLAVQALVRTDEQASALRRLGATPVIGDVRESERWAFRLAGVDVLLDLVQPRLPERLTTAAIDRVAAERVEAMSEIVRALSNLPPERRPLLMSVSGMTDLVKDERGFLSAASARRSPPVGFARIGVPVHELVLSSALPAAFVHLGTVYGPGKAFAARILPNLARGRMPIVGAGNNRKALVHVSDAARALVHLLSLERGALQGKTWLVADGANSTQREFMEHAARLMNGPVPRRLPRWLVSLIIGSVSATLLAEDAPVDNTELLRSGFHFEHASHDTGLPATVRALRQSSSVEGVASAVLVNS